MKSERRLHLDTAALFAIGGVMAVWCGWAYTRDGYFITRSVFVAQLSGYTALGFLGLSLTAGPLLRLGTWFGVRIESETSARLSRNAGIGSALAAIVHVVVVLTTYLDNDWQAVLTVPYLQSGGLAFVILMMLLIGSFKPLMKFARWKLWKPLFRLSFVAAAIALHHVLYAPFSSPTWTLGLFAGAAILSLLRFLPEPKVRPPSEEIAAERSGARRENTSPSRPSKAAAEVSSSTNPRKRRK